jgi:two-component system phosphate regulon response regulator PhoB
MRTILLADDEANLRTLVRTTLEDAEFNILEASDGPTTLDMVHGQVPDLLLLDWMMPKLSGLEVARALRRHPATAELPIIMLTAKGQQHDRDQAESLGLYDYLVKPFSPLDLLRAVEGALHIRRPVRGRP